MNQNYGKKGVRAKQRALNAKTPKLGRKLGLTLIKLTLAAAVGLVICCISAGLGAFKGILISTPQIHLSDVVASGEATIVYDCTGNAIDQYVSINSNRIQINDIDLIPKHLGNAFVAIEDERFYQHNGIDLEGIARAGWVFVQSMGKRKEGASTITQQLLKNTVFTTWTEEDGNLIKMIKRKFQEQYLAMAISKEFSKEDVLLRYMNAINLGQNTLGVESASRRYFGKSCSELTLSECAVIASITQNPYRLNPIRFPENNAVRRKKCLNNMLELGFITEAEHKAAMADSEAVYERIGLYDTSYLASVNTTAGSYFSDAVYEQVREDLINTAGYNETMAETLLTSGGLRIESTMDPAIQAIADEEFANPDNYPENVYWYLNYSLTIFGKDDEKHNFSKENMRLWFQQNRDTKFNLIFSSQDVADEAIVTYRTAMLEELGIADEEENYSETMTLVAQPQAAMVIEDQSTGYVVAMVGGRGTKEGRRTLNRATDAKRSPGSTFKVLAAFAPALDSAGQTLATAYLDAPFNYSDGTPVNNWYKTGYRGVNSIREAIRESLNIVAIKTETVITPQLGYDYLLNFGFTTLTDGVWLRDSNGNDKFFTDVNQTLALGGLTYGVTPYELNAAYASIANMGSYIQPKLYTKVTNAEGSVILDNTNPISKQIIKETTAFLLTDAMVDVVKGGGSGASCNFSKSMAIAGKTGTSTDTKDVWFSGFTPYYTCSVWAGYDNNIGLRTSNPGVESNLSKTLWRATMSRIHENLPSKQFYTPQGIVLEQVCTQSGLQPIPGICDTTRKEYFAEGTAPTEPCNIHYMGNVCSYDNLPATQQCPFPVSGVLTLPFVEHPALIEGSTTITQNPDGTETVNVPITSSPRCQHNEVFYADPNYAAVINQQALEIFLRNPGIAPVNPVPVDPGPVNPGATDPGSAGPGTADPGTIDPGPIDPGPVPVDPASAGPVQTSPPALPPGTE